MTATLVFNRLSIRAEGDDAFASAISENLPKLAELPHPNLELDIASSKNLGEAGFKAFGASLLNANDALKRLHVRAPIEFADWIVGSGLSALVRIDLVEHMDGPTKKASTKITAASKTGGTIMRDVTELAPETDSAPAELAPDESSIMDSQAPAPAKLTPAFLVDEEDGTRYEIGDELLIGREPPADPAFVIPTISKRHFRVFPQGRGYFIEDMRSTNGTYLNGDPLANPRPLADGDEVVVAITLKHPQGAKKFKFVLES